MWTLANAEERAREVSFEIPPREDREQLSVGDLVKLVFLDRDGCGERMWVEITHTQTDAVTEHYCGRLRNDPVQIDDLRYGDEIAFGPHHVTAIAEGDE